ncbi:pentapeptide repeat-containing protein [Algoriphagus sp. D3-2-R+10]|uniref:helix-turn-helix domain-containing protein n=1 Tax=Algoriphagus aurantiacus TaxID=3103948 RepID=UPI002B3B566A|nr:helix-turn-helix domain-containing protein [Algoriphagus sp. D3-2-R+10]MEB2774380.1 pentapeptide repeat-containing protein [Algoriphagus sp. D3-2-R+10]
MLDSKKIGDKIAGARKKINISQAQLAAQLFMSPQAVGKWERGESMPDISTFNRLAVTLGVDLNYFSENFNSLNSEWTSDKSQDLRSTEISTEKLKKKPVWDMSEGNWMDTDFSGLKNLHEKFSSSNIRRCQFIGSDMSELLLKSNYVDSCDFSDGNLSNCQIQGSYLTNNKFYAASFKNTQISTSHLTGCDFTDADCTGLTVKSSSLVKNTLINCRWKESLFKATSFENLVFEGVLEDCTFESCGFKKVTFQKAVLINTFFKNNNKLNLVRLIECKADRITYAFLQNAKVDLSGVTLLAD